MRELKFRAWDESLGRMVFSPTLEYRTDGQVFSRNFNKDGELVERPLMQYTGLKDQNGVEIYEGDIVAWGWDLSVVESVFYSTENAGYETETSCLDSCMTVIGNIHQNPELLEGRDG